MDNSQDSTNGRTKLFMGLTLSTQKHLYTYILSLVLSPADADDILQDTLTIMWKKFGEFAADTSFLSWGKQIARYRILDYYRKNKGSKLCFNQDVFEVVAARAEQPDDLSDQRAALKECLKTLSEKYLSLLKLRYSEELSYKQIAVEFSVSKQSLYRTMSRIHAALYKCIKGRTLRKGFYGT